MERLIIVGFLLYFSEKYNRIKSYFSNINFFGVKMIGKKYLKHGVKKIDNKDKKKKENECK